jgi:hypothetical protein
MAKDYFLRDYLKDYHKPTQIKPCGHEHGYNCCCCETHPSSKTTMDCVDFMKKSIRQKLSILKLEIKNLEDIIK